MAEKLVIKINGDTSNYKRALSTVQKGTQKLNDAVIGLSSKSVYAIAGIGAAIGLTVRNAAKIETMTTQFEVLQGSASQAKKTMEDLQKFSAKTPFQLPELVKASQKLLAFGVSSENLLERLRQLGDVSAATGKDINEISVIWGKIRAQNKLTGETFNQLREAGINVGPIIAKSMGVAESELADLVSKSKVSFDIFQYAFSQMSSEGGIAFKGMEKRSKTLEGKISTLKDDFFQLTVEIGKAFTPHVKELVDKLTASLQEMTKYAPQVKEIVSEIAEFSKFVAKGSLGEMIADEQEMSRVKGDLETAKNKLKEIDKAFKSGEPIAKNFWQEITGGGEKVTIETLRRAKQKVDELKNALDVLQGNGKLDTGGQMAGLDFEDVDYEYESKITKQKEYQAKFKENQIGFWDEMRELRLERDEMELGVQLTNEERDLERQILVDELKRDQHLKALNERIADEMDHQKKLDAIKEREALIESKREKIRIKNKKLTDQEYQKLEYEKMSAIAGIGQQAVELGKALGNENNKALLVAGKAIAAAQVIISAQVAAMQAWARGPETGATLTPLIYTKMGLSLATIAAQTFTAMAQGGLVTGGIPGRDSVPIMAQRGELVVPAQNFDEVVNAVRETRETGSSNSVTVNISGDFIGEESFIENNLIPKIRDAVLFSNADLGVA